MSTIRKHSFDDHYRDVFPILTRLSGQWKHDAMVQTVTMVAYERWLNDRDLLSVESPPKDPSDVRWECPICGEPPQQTEVGWSGATQGRCANRHIWDIE